MDRPCLAIAFLSIIKIAASLDLMTKVGSVVNITCDYSSFPLAGFGDVVLWKKVNAAALDTIATVGVVSQGWLDKYTMTFDSSSSVLVVKVHDVNQSGTYVCEIIKNQQIIGTHMTRLTVYGGPIVNMQWSDLSNDDVLKVSLSHPMSINFTLTAFNYVGPLVAVSVGQKNLTGETSCIMKTNPGNATLLDTVCSTSTLSVDQNDNNVLFTVTTAVPFFGTHTVNRVLAVLALPLVDCFESSLGLKGLAATLSCTIRSSPPPTSITWMRDGTQIFDNSDIKSNVRDQVDKLVVTLEFYTVAMEDFGMYTLNVTNEAGSTSDYITLLEAEMKTTKAVLTPLAVVKSTVNVSSRAASSTTSLAMAIVVTGVTMSLFHSHAPHSK